MNIVLKKNAQLKVIVRLKGGLGNQLFCYAAARRLALVNQAELIIDDMTGFVRDHEYQRKYALNKFHITSRLARPWERMEPFERYRRGWAKLISRQRPFEKRKYLEQEGIDFDGRLLNYKIEGTVYLDGLWQSEDYFKDIEDVIRNDLRIVAPTDPADTAMAKKILSVNAVCVHVRWFDKPGQSTGDFGYNVPSRYYQKAVELISDRFERPHFFVFSDHPEMAKSITGIPEDLATYLDHNLGEENAYADLRLMTLCKHFVIANSTFSWWGAWLGSSKKSVVFSPAFRSFNGACAWGFEGLIPNRWIIL
jgi:hypothetical protein